MGLANLPELPSGAARPVQTAARLSLHSHLATTADLLTLAADDKHRSAELVHQLRVQTRRCLAAISAYQACLPKQQAKWFRKRLRQIRRAASDARDLDVFLQRYQHDDSAKFRKLRRWVKRRRRKAQKPIKALHRKWIATGRFARRTEELLRRIDVPDSRSLAEWSLPQLAHLATDCVDAAPTVPADANAFHRFRVRVKSLRYAIDLYAPVLDPADRARFVKRLSKLQKKLGELNDHSTAVSRLQSWQGNTSDKSLRLQMQKLIRSEKRSLKFAMKAFDKSQLDKTIARLTEFADFCESRITPNP
jgi:CHAD domain-containing protein